VWRPAVFAPLLFAVALAASVPYVDRGFPNPDEGAILTAAARILRGAVFYRDLDTYPFPGSHFLAAAAMAAFGEHLAVARWIAAIAFAGTVGALYAIALPLVGAPRAALFGLALLALKPLGFPGFSVYAYWDLAFLAACAAIALALRHRPGGPLRSLVGAGVCAGLALTFKQNVGLYLGAAIVALLWFPSLSGGGVPRGRRVREIAVFGLAGAVPVLAMGVYFASHGLLLQMIESGLLRPLTGYLPTSGVAFSPMLAWWQLGELRGRPGLPYLPLDAWYVAARELLPGPASVWWLAIEIASRAIYTSLPLAFAWAALRRLRTGPGDDADRRLFAFAVLALSVVLTAFPRADIVHVLSVYPLAGLLLYALQASSPRLAAWAPRARFAAEAAAVALLVATAGALAHVRHAPLTHRATLERAEVWIEPKDAWVQPLVEVVQQQIAPDEPFFVYGHEAQLYFLTGRFSPWRFSQLYPGQEGGEEGRELAMLLARRPPRLVVQGILRWPGTPELPEYAPALDAWIRSRYRADRKFFVRHPPPAGEAPKPTSVVVLQLGKAGGLVPVLRLQRGR
jgi:hypothetical protein